MKRTVAAVIFAVFAITTPTSHAQNVATKIPEWRTSDWMRELIVSDEWIVLGASRNNDSAHFLNRSFRLSENGNPVVFIRIEEMTPQTLAYVKYLSFRITAEVDCRRFQSRELEETLFSGRNLDGPLLVQHVTGAAGNWTYPPPNTMGEAQVQGACSLAANKKISK
jgi:hypothetical protein